MAGGAVGVCGEVAGQRPATTRGALLSSGVGATTQKEWARRSAGGPTSALPLDHATERPHGDGDVAQPSGAAAAHNDERAQREVGDEADDG